MGTILGPWRTGSFNFCNSFIWHCTAAQQWWMWGVCSHIGRAHCPRIATWFYSRSKGYFLLLSHTRHCMEFIVSVHVKNSEKHKNIIPLSTKANGKPASKETDCLSDWQINIKQSCHCHISLLRRMLQLTTQQLCHGKTQTLSCWTSALICKTESGSENASNETLLDIMDNQESTDFITLTPWQPKPIYNLQPKNSFR